METFFAKRTARKNAPRFLLARHAASDERLAILRAAIARHPTEEITPLYIDWEQVKNELCDSAQNKPECVL